MAATLYYESWYCSISEKTTTEFIQSMFAGNITAMKSKLNMHALEVVRSFDTGGGSPTVFTTALHDQGVNDDHIHKYGIAFSKKKVLAAGISRIR